MVETGLERVLAGEVPSLEKKRLGLIANPTAVDSSLRHIIDRFAADPRINLCALFGPEHGLRGAAQDMIAVDASADPQTGLPVFSLYGQSDGTLAPTAAMLSGLDAVVFDIQDIGSRYYTYVWTMVLAMRACAEAGLAFYVLDRPNPIGGDAVEGGAIADGYRSFVGLLPVPNRHGMTAGEIAGYARETLALDLDLHVVTMTGWRRTMRYADTGLAWVMPSPNMPTPDTALVYPGMCLIEGTELSEGRGTTRPFEIFGAPFIDGDTLAAALEPLDLPGVRWRPLTFLPTFQKHAGHPCGGVQLHVTDARAFLPYRTGVAALWAIHKHFSDHFAWRQRAYEFVADRPAIDLLCGSPAIREGIDGGADLGDLAATWRDGEAEFLASRQRYLLYP